LSTSTSSEMVDRQRQRAERGIGTSRKPGGRLPTTAKRRRPAIAALAALLIVGGALIAGVLAVRMDERVGVVQVAADVGVGEKITKDDLAEARVAGDSLNLIPANRAAEIIGTYAKVNLVKGQLLDPKMLTRTSPITTGKAAVGVVLVDGRVPAEGLHAGDWVALIRIGQGAVPPVEIGQGTVLNVPAQAAEGSGLGSKASTAQTVTVLVDRADVTAIVDASGNNRIAIALLKSGMSVGER
jgi:SAF domain